MSIYVYSNGSIVLGSSAGGGSSALTFTRDMSPQEVIEDTVTPANNVPLPVKITGVTGDINVTAQDLHVQLEHTGVNPDSVRIGDGVETVTYVLDNAVDTGPSTKVGGRIEDDVSANAYADNDRQAIHLDAKGRVHVNPATSDVADNDPSTENATPASGVYNATPPIYGDGDKADLQLDVNGNVKLSPSTVADNEPATENATPVSGVYNLTPPTYGDGDKADLQLDVNGKLLTSSAVSSGVADNDADSENPIKIGAKTKDPTTMPTYVADDRANLHTDLSGRLLTLDETLRAQDAANNAADAGNPVKVGGVYNATPPTLDDGDRGDAQLESDGSMRVSAVSSVADNAPSTENPIPVSGKYIASPTNYSDGDKATFLMDQKGALKVAPASNVGDNAADTENPIKVGGRAINPSIPPTYIVGDKANFHTDLSGNLIVSDANVLEQVTRAVVVDQIDTTPLLDLSSTNIPASASLPLQILASTNTEIKKLVIVEDVGEFIGIYTGAAAAEVLVAIMPLGGGEMEVSIALGARVSVRNMKNAAITTGFYAVNFLG